MALILVDSDVLIDVLRGRESSFLHVRRSIEHGLAATTTINAFELRSRARDPARAKKIEILLETFAIYPFDRDAEQSATSVRRTLESAGRGIGMADYLIAGIALSRALPLLTRNRRHFERVPGLRLIDL